MKLRCAPIVLKKAFALDAASALWSIRIRMLSIAQAADGTGMKVVPLSRLNATAGITLRIILHNKSLAQAFVLRYHVTRVGYWS